MLPKFWGPTHSPFMGCSRGLTAGSCARNTQPCCMPHTVGIPPTLWPPAHWPPPRTRTSRPLPSHSAAPPLPDCPVLPLTAYVLRCPRRPLCGGALMWPIATPLTHRPLVTRRTPTTPIASISPPSCTCGTLTTAVTLWLRTPRGCAYVGTGPCANFKKRKEIMTLW